MKAFLPPLPSTLSFHPFFCFNNFFLFRAFLLLLVYDQWYNHHMNSPLSIMIFCPMTSESTNLFGQTFNQGELTQLC